MLYRDFDGQALVGKPGDQSKSKQKQGVWLRLGEEGAERKKCWEPNWAGSGAQVTPRFQGPPDSHPNPRAPVWTPLPVPHVPGICGPTLHWAGIEPGRRVHSRGGQEADLTCRVRFPLAPPGGAPMQDFLSPQQLPGSRPGAPAES